MAWFEKNAGGKQGPDGEPEKTLDARMPAVKPILMTGAGGAHSQSRGTAAAVTSSGWLDWLSI